MYPKAWTMFCSVVAVSGLLFLTVVSVADQPDDAKKPASAEEKDDVKRLSVDAARERAKLIHSVYTTTLGVMHHRYFHDDRAVVPARAMEDVFLEIARQENIQARWISVNARAMSINHKPQDDFEKAAAKAISKSGKDFERIEDGNYRRAEAVPLTAGCIGCHGRFGRASQTARFAGLTISIPVKQGSKLPEK